jgi:glycosyltransferase EpsJ
LVSVIVPVWNCEPYIHDCINSIIGQTETDWEIIAIDDGSTDHTGAILNDLSRLEPRLAVLHQDNSGVSHALNRGLGQARGEWLAFIAGDDEVDPDFLRHLLNAATEATDAVFYTQMTEFNDRGKTRLIRVLDTGPNSGTEVMRSVLQYGKGVGALGIIRRSAVTERQVRFSEDTGYGEDTLFMSEFLPGLADVRRVDESRYRYRRSATATTRARMTEKTRTELLAAVEHMAATRLPELFPDLWQRYVCRQMTKVVLRSPGSDGDSPTVDTALTWLMKRRRALAENPAMDRTTRTALAVSTTPWLRRLYQLGSDHGLWQV